MQAREQCLEQPEVAEALAEITLKEWLDVDALSHSVTEQIRSASFNAAAQLPEWEAARNEYTACIEEAGLTPEPDGWGSQEETDLSIQHQESSGKASEAEIRVAVAQATCNNEVNLTQRLGDLVASYQVPLIRDHEAALQQESQESFDKLAAARKVLGE